jgi:putative ABC transport system permease protein
MFISDVIRRSGRSLKSAKLRTILTALAIAVGGFTLTMTLAAGNGIREYTDRLVASNFDPSELIVGRDKEVENDGAPLTEPKEYDESVSSLQLGNNSSLQIKQVTDEDVVQLKSLPFVEQVRENYQLLPRYITRDGQKKFTLSAQAYVPSQKPELESGELPQSSDISAGDIVIPSAYLEPLGFSSAQDAIGKTVQVNIQEPFTQNSQPQGLERQLQDKTLDFNVVAVTKRSPTSIEFGALPVLFSNSDSREIYDFTTKGTANYGKYIFVFAKIKDGNDQAQLQAAQNKLKDLGYYTQSSKDIQQSITQIVNILQALVAVFGVVTLVASVFGIVNTQYISVLERTREIGLMKALGMRKRDVGRLFRFEAAWIGFLGGAIGTISALAVGLPLNPWITKQLNLGEGNSLLVFNAVQMIALVIVLMLVAMIAGYLPSRKAAKLDPIEALRTE